ncbi:MAG: Smr/MutS family protein [Saprospiraceae bacterium]|nr:Smr/MutS family protein [Saprospiraceae bacterium]
MIRTNDTGVVTALLEHGMLQVSLDGSDMEIPVFEEDIVHYTDPLRDQIFAKAKVVPAPKKYQAEPPPPRTVSENQYAILRSSGVQIAFDPAFRSDASIEKYLIFLINDTRYEVVYNFVLSFNGRVAKQQDGKLEAVTALQVGELTFDQLNESPEVELSCWRVTTEGPGAELKKVLKIKPQQFFKKVLTAPLLNRPVHLFRIFENIKDEPSGKQDGEDLLTYTKRQATPAKFLSSQYHSGHVPHEVREKAEFSPEIDLHIEQLAENWAKLSNAEILQIQLRHFDAFIEKSIRLGVERVFIIHGLGTGRLRDTIATRLLRIPEVKTFKNEYHPRYGHGATEVIFE